MRQEVEAKGGIEMNRGMYGIQEEEKKDKKETKGVRIESRHSS